MRPRLLIVEDDGTLRIGLVDTFELEGMEVTAAENGDRAARLLESETYDLVLLDLMLPGRGGLEILRELRGRGDRVPVLVLTARGEESDRVFGLEIGADDYVTKPFSLRELVARVRALLRRTAAPSSTQVEIPTTLRLGDVEVDLAAYQVRRGEDVQTLSRTEADILALLVRHRGHAVHRRQFLEEVWGPGVIVGHRTIDTHVLNLRHKLEADPAQPRFVQTVHGVGYRLVVPDGDEESPSDADPA